MNGPTQDPAVLSWEVAIAGYRHAWPRPRRRHWWRELVTDTWRAASDAREALRESGHLVDVAGGVGAQVSAYQLEAEEFDRLYPAPRLADYMRHLSHGQLAPGEWGHA